MSKSNSVRLSKYVIPNRYEIQMRPDLESFTFAGEERIKLEVTKAAKQITLHAAEIELLQAQWEAGKQTLPAKQISYNPKQETVTISFAQTIKGKGVLYLSFNGVLNDKLRGFYRSSYTHKGKQQHLATTQFEATDARRAFPSFDEPAQKAIFDVSVIIPTHLTAISNTIETEVSAHDPGFKVVTFAPSPKMSTYLLAFIVGDFESVQTETKNGVVVRVFTTPGKTKHAKFALDVAKRSLEFLEDYFAISYPLPVMDLVAVPDFSAAAMENWGAVTFRETALLVDEKHTPFVNRERVAEVIAHELVHQWFGNLVTMEWWTHLWLNESFTHYMAYVTLDHLFPQWNIWTKFVLGEQTKGLALDSMKHTHPIEVEVHHPSEIEQIFDLITYSKGPSVLRMLANYIGDDTFRDGVRYYLKKHSYKNTSSVHLWEAFEKIAKKPVRKLMKQWTTVAGYPVVSATRKGNTLHVQQHLFSLTPQKAKPQWLVPVQARLNQNTVSNMYLLQKVQGQLPLPDDFEYVKLNHNEHGFYRGHYDPSLLAQLLVAVSEKRIDVIDRLGIIRDLFALCKAGMVPTDVYLEALHYYKEDDSYVVWSQIAGDFEELYHALEDDKIAVLVETFGRELFSPLVATLGWKQEKKETTARALLRAVAIRNAGRYGDKKVIAKAKQLFTGHVRGKHIDPNLRTAVYETVAEHGGKTELAAMQQLYTQTELHEEQTRLGYALMLFRGESLQKKVLQFALSDAVRSQDMPFMIRKGMEGAHTRPLIWNTIQAQWELILNRFAKGSLLGKIINGIGYFTTTKELAKAEQFFKTHRHPGAEQVLKQALEQVRITISWMQRDKNLISRYLKNN